MNDELDPRFLAALRSVAPADEAVREAHLSAAVAAVGHARERHARRNTSWLAAAAAVVFLVGGFAIGRGSSDAGSGDALAREAASTSIKTKGSSPGLSSAVAPCAAEFPDHRYIDSYAGAIETLLVFLRLDDSHRVTIVRSADCTIVEEINLP